MATTKAEFQSLAAELFEQEFADFAPLRAFIKPGTGGTFDPVSETTTGGEDEVIEYVRCIREDYKAGQYDNDQIQIGDFKLLAQANSFADITPRTDGVTVYVDDIFCQIVTAEKDAADAVWTMQVRVDGAPNVFVADLENWSNSDPLGAAKTVDVIVNEDLPE